MTLATVGNYIATQLSVVLYVVVAISVFAILVEVLGEISRRKK